MDNLLQHFRSVGVHYLKKNDSVMMLEILEDRLDFTAEIDVLINELLDNLQSNGLEKVRFECPKVLLDSLNCTRTKMKIVDKRMATWSSIYQRTIM